MFIDVFAIVYAHRIMPFVSAKLREQFLSRTFYLIIFAGIMILGKVLNNRKED